MVDYLFIKFGGRQEDSAELLLDTEIKSYMYMYPIVTTIFLIVDF
jgi:hypothetical protein